jgi:hypothetical protein
MPVLAVVLAVPRCDRTILTSNTALEDWGKLVGDVLSATAIRDHFLQHSALIQITGRSYRLQDARKEDQTPSLSRKWWRPLVLSKSEDHGAG